MCRWDSICNPFNVLSSWAVVIVTQYYIVFSGLFVVIYKVDLLAFNSGLAPCMGTNNDSQLSQFRRRPMSKESIVQMVQISLKLATNDDHENVDSIEIQDSYQWP